MNKESPQRPSGQTTESTDTEQSNQATDQRAESAPGVLSVLQSVLAAMFGVQSDEKRKQDFEKGHPGTYIFVGVVIVIIFVVSIIQLVKSILADAGM